MPTERETRMLPNSKGFGPHQTEWIKSDWFCMECGKQDVWQDADGDDDYYDGWCARCLSCGHVMIGLEQISRVKP